MGRGCTTGCWGWAGEATRAAVDTGVDCAGCGAAAGVAVVMATWGGRGAWIGVETAIGVAALTGSGVCT